MGSAVRMRADYSAGALRRLATRTKDVRQSRRLLSLVAVADGMSREETTRIGGTGRQTLRDWAPSARCAASAPALPCPMQTPKPCRPTPTRSAAMSQGAACRAAHGPLRLAHHRQAQRAEERRPQLAAVARAGAEPGRERLAISAPDLRRNRLSSRVFDGYDAIIAAARDAWPKLLAQPHTITSIGMREWAHVGQRK